MGKGNPNETAADRFKRLANARMGKAEKVISQLGLLTGSTYEKTSEQVNAIEKHLTKFVADAVASLRLGKGTAKIVKTYV